MSKAKPAPKADGPTFTALSVQRIEGNWQVVEYQIQDGQIVATKSVAEPQFRQDALNLFRITAAKAFMGDV